MKKHHYSRLFCGYFIACVIVIALVFSLRLFLNWAITEDVNIEKKEKVDIVTFTLRPEENTGSEILQWQAKFAKETYHFIKYNKFIKKFVVYEQCYVEINLSLSVTTGHLNDSTIPCTVCLVYSSGEQRCKTELYTKGTSILCLNDTVKMSRNSSFSIKLVPSLYLNIDTQFSKLSVKRINDTNV